ncbi:MAG: UMP kinase [Simkaniaceae bacterium]|nr:UMP kinase [Simkaniaceae bacterium]MCF7852416.1 UMP kinase [Simkaniaceae bacterium]
MPQLAYDRVLLKLSGEALADHKSPTGVDHTACQHIADAIIAMKKTGVEIGVVVGGGNIFRGNQAPQFGLSKTPADHIGMLATAINGIILSQMIQKLGFKSHVMSAIPLNHIAEPFEWAKAKALLSDQTILFFVGGTGNPYFSTDTAAALRAIEMDCSILIKATKVDGVYDKDPKQYADAQIFSKLTYNDVLNQRLNVMDATAIALCRENQIPIQVVNLFSKEALLKVLYQEPIGTIVTEGE